MWEAEHYGSAKKVNNVEHKLKDIDFETLRQFTLFPKKGLPVSQVFALRFPEKSTADYRLLFRFKRVFDPAKNVMLPAQFMVGMERLTPENEAFLKDFERGKAVEPDDFPEVRDGFRLWFDPSGDIGYEGEVVMHPVAKKDVVTIYLTPVGA